MPLSIQDILDHANDLAQRFEEFDSAEAEEISVEEYLLQRAVVARAKCEQQVLEAVAKARSAELSWNKIGELLGTSAQAAHQRYGIFLESA
jgi:hypothetical protein